MKVINKENPETKHGYKVGEIYYVDGELLLVCEDERGAGTTYRFMTLDTFSLGDASYDSLQEMADYNPTFRVVNSKIVIE